MCKLITLLAASVIIAISMACGGTPVPESSFTQDDYIEAIDEWNDRMGDLKATVQPCLTSESDTAAMLLASDDAREADRRMVRADDQLASLLPRSAVDLNAQSAFLVVYEDRLSALDWAKVEGWAEEFIEAANALASATEEAFRKAGCDI